MYNLMNNVYNIVLKYSLIDTICYDDACHLKKFATNPKRCNLTDVASVIAKKNIVCDRFHFKNHIDKWCVKNCNPYECDELKVLAIFLRRCIIVVTKVEIQFAERMYTLIQFLYLCCNFMTVLSDHILNKCETCKVIMLILV